MLGRIARRLRPLAWQAQALIYRGSQFHCPVCEADVAAMLPLTGTCTIRGEVVDLTTPNAICPKCRSDMRQRLMAQFIRERTDLLAGKKVLHVAPEQGLARMLRRHTQHVGIDLNPERFPGAVRGDLTALPFHEEFDGIICSHVLEHIPDDQSAIQSIHGALKLGGVALIAVPTYGDVTYERPGLSPTQRDMEYGNPDHFRLNGRDFSKRIEKAGFTVDIITPDDLPGNYLDRTISTHHTNSDWLLFVAHKPYKFASAVTTGATKLTA